MIRLSGPQSLAIADASFRPAGSFAKPSAAPTHTLLFVTMLCGVVILVGALTFIPALALGPIVEQLLAQS